MPIYTFYCCAPDGAAPSFEAHALASDQAARARAAMVLQQHVSASHVEVFDRDRPVLTLRRVAPPVGA